MYQKIHKISNIFLISQSIFRQFIISAEQKYFFWKDERNKLENPLPSYFLAKRKHFASSKQEAKKQQH